MGRSETVQNIWDSIRSLNSL